MPITLGRNIAALGVQRKLAETSNQLGKVYERLASGLRINSASDDAAGLALGTSLSTDSKILGTALRNVSDGISVLAIAESAAQSLSRIIDRSLELAEQAANGAYSSTQRQALDTEAQALVAEYSRIVQTTTFNGSKLLDGSKGSFTLQAGTGANISSVIAVLLPNFNANTTVPVGDGSFTTGSAYGVYSDPSGITSGDFNGDGINDIITGLYGPDDLVLLIGNGDGTFKAGISINMAYGNQRYIASADINGDGKLDVVSGNNNSTGVSVSIGNGDGTFLAQVSYGTISDTNLVTLIDVNGDGRKDIVSSSGTAGQKIGVLINAGSGTFLTEVTYFAGPAASGPVQHAFGDVNSDGVNDLIVTERSTGYAGVLLGNANGTFNAYTTFAMAGGTILDIVATDINGDSKIDLVGIDSGVGKLVVRLGNGNGTFSAPNSYTVSVGNPSFLESGDFNGDGKNDLLLAGQYNNQVQVLLGNGDGTYKIYQNLTVSTQLKRNPFTVSDFNQDGISDFAIAAFGTGAGGSDLVNVYLGNGNGINTSLTINLSFSLLTQSGAQTAITYLNSAKNTISSNLGILGAGQSRLVHAYNFIDVERENYASAAARITDIDVAETVAEMLRLSILQSAGAALLAQANQQSSLVLKLLAE